MKFDIKKVNFILIFGLALSGCSQEVEQDIETVYSAVPSNDSAAYNIKDETLIELDEASYEGMEERYSSQSNPIDSEENVAVKDIDTDYEEETYREPAYATQLSEEKIQELEDLKQYVDDSIAGVNYDVNPESFVIDPSLQKALDSIEQTMWEQSLSQ